MARGTHRELRFDLAFGSFSGTWLLLSSLRGRLLPVAPHSVLSRTEEDRLRLNEVCEDVPTDSDSDGNDGPSMNRPVDG